MEYAYRAPFAFLLHFFRTERNVPVGNQANIALSTTHV